jgi:hypothetical protein
VPASRILAIPSRSLLSACALAVALALPGGVRAAPGPVWPLPGVASGLTVGEQDFVADFRRADLVQLERQGGFARSDDPAHPAQFGQGLLLTVQGISPSCAGYKRHPSGRTAPGSTLRSPLVVMVQAT